MQRNAEKIKLKGKTSAFSGNSGVGKSSITSKLIGEEEEKIEVDDIDTTKRNQEEK